MNYHLGEWISFHARAERVPPRLTVSITLGELPDGWSRKGGQARTWSGLVGLVLIAPFALLLTATVLHHLGIDFTRRYEDEFQRLRNRLSDGKPVRDLG